MDASDPLESLRRGLAIPALPLALDAARRLDERRQRALLRYYFAAGAGGVAVGVHTTQFAIRDVGLFEPVLQIAKATNMWPRLSSELFSEATPGLTRSTRVLRACW